MNVVGQGTRGTEPDQCSMDRVGRGGAESRVEWPSESWGRFLNSQPLQLNIEADINYCTPNFLLKSDGLNGAGSRSLHSIRL